MIPVLALHLDKIEKNPGLLPIKEGQAVISNDKWTIIKTLDLNIIYDELESNMISYRKFKNYLSTFNASNSIEFCYIKTQAEGMMSLTKERFMQLVPTRNIRSKRGLINPLGSLVKFITGNLDNDDASRYDQMIKDLKNKQDLISKRVTIISEMAGIISNFTETTQRNFIQLQNEINLLKKEFNDTHKFKIESKIIKILTIYFNNFLSIFLQLDEIETAVAFSRVKVLHQSIIDNKELLSILKEIEKTDKLVFPAKLSNLVKIEPTIELQAYIKERQITFIMRIPLITSDIYNYYKVIPLPVLNQSNVTTLIPPKYPFLLVKEVKTQPLANPCQEVDQNLYLCYEDDITTHIEDTCVASLLKFESNTSTCHPVPVEINTLHIRPIYENRWIIYTNKPIILQELCKGEIMRKQLLGTYLLEIDSNCEVKVNDIQLRKRHTDGHEIRFHKSIKISLPELPLLTSIDVKPVNLDNIDLENLQLLSYALKKNSESVVQSLSKITVKSVSLRIIIVSLIVTILLIILIFVFFKYKNHFKCKLCAARNRPKKNSSDNFELKEEGVMGSQPNEDP